MAHSLLSEIHKDSNQWTICVLISRKWHYRGGTDEGPIKHTDLVLLDTEGNHMYGQIPATSVDRFKDVLEEGKVYVIRKFFCNPSRSSFRPVESSFMVQFIKYTIVEERPGLEDTYPLCTYSLTMYPDIPDPGFTTRFIDVIGKIDNVSDLIPVQSMHQATASDTRTVVLTDLLGNELKLVLWGDRAVEFDAEAVRAMGAKEPVVAIFVGALPKAHRGVRGLSGSSACRWYIDEDIPDINSFRASLRDKFVPMPIYTPVGPDAIVPRVYEKPMEKTVSELIKDVDPFEEMDKKFVCTVTIDRLTSDQRWWFASCSTCRKSSKYDGYQYKCSSETCSSVKAILTYCISVFASDATGEAEFVFFDKVAAGAVGRPLAALLRKRYPGQTTSEDIAIAARHDTGVPVEISALVGQKYRLLVCISKKWSSGGNNNSTSDDLSFQVSRIEETYKPELPPLLFGVASGSAEASSSVSGSGMRFPLGGAAISPAQREVPTPTSHSKRGSLPEYGSPTNQSPASPIVKLPATPVQRASAPKRSARRSLFRTPSKANQQPNIQDPIAAEKDDVVGVKDDVPLVAEDKEDEILPPKIKRNTGAPKSAGSNKKQKG